LTSHGDTSSTLKDPESVTESNQIQSRKMTKAENRYSRRIPRSSPDSFEDVDETGYKAMGAAEEAEDADYRSHALDSASESFEYGADSLDGERRRRLLSSETAESGLSSSEYDMSDSEDKPDSAISTTSSAYAGPLRDLNSPMDDASEAEALRLLLQAMTDLEKSFVFSSTLWNIILACGMCASCALFLSQGLWATGRVVVSHLYDASNTFLAANLLATFLFIFYPRKSLVMLWAAFLGVSLALQNILPPLILTRFLVSSPAALGGSKPGHWLGGLFCVQNACALFTLKFLFPFFTENILSSIGAFYVLVGALVFGVNLKYVQRIGEKEEELGFLRCGLDAHGGLPGGPNSELAE